MFGAERFSYEHRTENGYVRVLDKFNEKSKLLFGLANYSISFLVANPRTFITPGHFDADCVCYVVEGTMQLTYYPFLRIDKRIRIQLSLSRL